MQIESQILGIINDKLKNPIYTIIRLLNMKTILTKSNFTKKDGVAAHMVILHFVYMLVMNKKISTLGIERKVDLLFQTPYTKEQNIFETAKNEGVLL